MCLFHTHGGFEFESSWLRSLGPFAWTNICMLVPHIYYAFTDNSQLRKRYTTQINIKFTFFFLIRDFRICDNTINHTENIFLILL